MLLSCPNCTTCYDIDPAALGATGRSLRCARCRTTWFAAPVAESVSEVFGDIEVITTINPPAQATPAAGERNTSEPNGAAPAPAPPAPLDEATPAPALAETSAAEAPLAPDPSGPNGASEPGTQGEPEATPPLADAPVGEDIETVARRLAEQEAHARRMRRQYTTAAFIPTLILVLAVLIAWRGEIVRLAPQMASLYAALGLPVNTRALVFENVKTTWRAAEGAPLLIVEGAIVSTTARQVEVPRLRFAVRNQAGQEIHVWSARPERAVLPPGASLPFRSRLASPPSDGREVMVRFFHLRDVAATR